MTAGLFGRQEGRKLSTSARTISPDQRITLGHGLPEVALLKQDKQQEVLTMTSGGPPN